MLTKFRQWLKSHTSPALWQTAVTIILFTKTLLPRRFEHVLYRLNSADEVDLGDLTIETIEIGQALTDAQRAFIRRDLTGLSLWTNLKSEGEGWECIYMAIIEGHYCAYMFCKAVGRSSRFYDVIREPTARVMGPGYVAPEYRKRGIYVRLRRFVAWHAAQRGFGPFYILVHPTNAPNHRSITLAGGKRLGLWAGTTALRYRWGKAERIAD